MESTVNNYLSMYNCVYIPGYLQTVPLKNITAAAAAAAPPPPTTTTTSAATTPPTTTTTLGNQEHNQRADPVRRKPRLAKKLYMTERSTPGSNPLFPKPQTTSAARIQSSESPMTMLLDFGRHAPCSLNSIHHSPCSLKFSNKSPYSLNFSRQSSCSFSFTHHSPCSLKFSNHPQFSPNFSHHSPRPLSLNRSHHSPCSLNFSHHSARSPNFIRQNIADKAVHLSLIHI